MSSGLVFRMTRLDLLDGRRTLRRYGTSVQRARARLRLEQIAITHQPHIVTTRSRNHEVILVVGVGNTRALVVLLRAVPRRIVLGNHRHTATVEHRVAVRRWWNLRLDAGIFEGDHARWRVADAHHRKNRWVHYKANATSIRMGKSERASERECVSVCVCVCFVESRHTELWWIGHLRRHALWDLVVWWSHLIWVASIERSSTSLVSNTDRSTYVLSLCLSVCLSLAWIHSELELVCFAQTHTLCISIDEREPSYSSNDWASRRCSCS
jgi:hypothetical protein